MGGKGQKGGKKGKGKAPQRQLNRPYRGNRAGQGVQAKRARAWEAEGWARDPETDEWFFVGIPEGEDEPEEEDRRSRTPSARASRGGSQSSSEIQRQLDEALSLAQREAQARVDLERRLRALEAAVARRPEVEGEVGGEAEGAPQPAYGEVGDMVEAPAPPSEAALSDELRSQALSNSNDSRRSKILSEGVESEAMIAFDPVFQLEAVAEEVDYSRARSRKPSIMSSQSSKVEEAAEALIQKELRRDEPASTLKLLPRQPPYPPPKTYKSVVTDGEKGKGKSGRIEPTPKAVAVDRERLRLRAAEEADDAEAKGLRSTKGKGKSQGKETRRKGEYLRPAQGTGQSSSSRATRSELQSSSSRLQADRRNHSGMIRRCRL